MGWGGEGEGILNYLHLTSPPPFKVFFTFILYMHTRILPTYGEYCINMCHTPLVLIYVKNLGYFMGGEGVGDGRGLPLSYC